MVLDVAPENDLPWILITVTYCIVEPGETDYGKAQMQVQRGHWPGME